MKRVLFLLVFFWVLEGFLPAQEPPPMPGVIQGSGRAIAVPIPIPFFRNSNSVVDVHGNLVIFDRTFNFPRPLPGTPSQPPQPPPPPTTRVTVVSRSQNALTSRTSEYTGYFESTYVGSRAVYATASVYSIAVGVRPGLLPRSLVAMDTGRALPTTLPSIPVQANEDVKIVSGSSVDMIYVVPPSYNPFILAPTGPVSEAPIARRIVRAFQFDGTKFEPAGAVTLP